MTARFVTLSVLAALALALAAPRLPAPPLPPATASGLTALEKYLFDDVTLVGVANVKAAVASPLYAKLKKEVAAVADHEFFARYLKPFGVKPIQDIERVVFVMGEQKVRDESFNRGPGPRENQERMYFLFQGKFDEKKFADAFAQLAKEHNQVKLHGTGRGAILQPDHNIFVSLIDRSTFIFAPSKKIVEEVQARASGKAKAKFKFSKDFPAALKSLRADTAIDAVGFGPMQVSSKFESMGKDGYRLTPVTLEQIGFSRLTVRVEAKDDLKGKLVFEAGKGNFADSARKMTDGLDEIKKRGQARPRQDPFEQALLKVFYGVTARTGANALTFEARLGADDARAFLDAMKKEFDRMSQPPDRREKK